MQRQAPDSRDHDKDHDDLAPLSNIAAQTVTIPTELFDVDTTTAIGHYIREFIYPGKTMKAGKYINNTYATTFTLDHNVEYCGELDGSIVTDTSAPLLKCLLHESHDNQYFAAGQHLIAEIDSAGAISKYRFIITQHDMAVRKDKYGNLVCDIINNNSCLGSGGFGGVYPVIGTIKPRVYAPNGLKFEPNEDRRLYKIVENKNKERDAFCVSAEREDSLTKRCSHLASRHSIFGVSAHNKLMYGMSIRKFNGTDFYDFIEKDTWGKDPVDYDEYFQVSIKMFEQLKKQIHDKGIVHRDLKPENILIHKNASGYEIEIIDLGCAKLKNDKDESNPGTHTYAAPERFFEGTSTEATDIFSMALIVALLWRDRNQRRISGLSVNHVVRAREACDWNINFDVFYNMPSLPDACKTMLMQFLLAATKENPQSRLSMDECIKSLKNIYQTYKELKLSFKDNGAAIKSAQEAEEQTQQVLTAYAKLPMSQQHAKAMSAELKKIINSLPDTNIAVFEFMGKFAFTCFTGCRNKAMVIGRIDNVVNEFFSTYEMLSRIQSELNDTLMQTLASSLKDDDERAVRLFKDINHLSAFRSKILESTLDLDTMYNETEHMRKKYRKTIKLKEHLHALFIDVSNPTTSYKQQ